VNRLIIDVREPVEFMMGHVKGAINIPPSKLMNGAKALRDVPKDTEIILYCQTGSRSAFSARIMKDMGYTNMINGINKGQVAARYGVN